MTAYRSVTESGLSLIEMMVAVLLSSIIAIGLMDVWLHMRLNHRQIEHRIRLQEQANFALQVMAGDIRLAGFTGCPLHFSQVFVLQQPHWYTGDFMLHAVRGAHAYTQNSEVGLVKPDSDILMLNRIDAARFLPIVRQTDTHLTLLTAIRFRAGDVFMVRSADCRYLVQIMAAINGQSRNMPFLAAPNVPRWGAEAELFEQVSVAYFLRGQSLFRKQTQDNAQEIIQNVSAFTLEYGVQNAQQAVVYQQASELNDAAQIVSVRVTLELNNADYGLPAQTFTQTVAVRNSL